MVEERRSERSSAGLADVIAAQSSICYIDGVRGILRYRGYPIEELSERASFEEVIHLLWQGELPAPAELARLREELGAATRLPVEVLRLLHAIPKAAHPVSAIRTAMSFAGHLDTDAEHGARDPAAARRTAVKLCGWIAAVTAAWDRVRRGKEALPPRPDLPLAASFLWMLHGELPSPTAVDVLDQCLTLHAEHEFNASTFTGRVVAATLSDVHSAIVGALGALKGPLHGGANTDVMRMLLELDAAGGGNPEGAREYIRGALAAGRKVSGFGHRVYRAPDPRATQLRKLSERVAVDRGETKWFEMSLAIEEAFRAERPNLPANVDFFSASTYYVLGIVPDMFTPIFAVARMSGWLAHVLEQYDRNRLIRPRAEYTGPPERHLPAERRKSL